jgi:PAS domain S-box-containing protein
MERFFKKVLDHLPDLVCIVDQKGTIRYVNHAVEKVLGYAQHEIIERSLETFIVNYSWSSIRHFVSTSNPDVFVSEDSWKNSKGDYLFLESRVQFISKSEDGLLFILDCRDLQARLDKENETARQLMNLKHYVLRVAHDIRVPLTSILGLVDLLERHPERATDILNHIKKSAHRLNEEILGFKNTVWKDD